MDRGAGISSQAYIVWVPQASPGLMTVTPQKPVSFRKTLITTGVLSAAPEGACQSTPIFGFHQEGPT